MNSVHCNVQYTVQFIRTTIVSGICIGSVLCIFGTLKENLPTSMYFFCISSRLNGMILPCKLSSHQDQKCGV
jgi:hypothetical protein